VSPELYITGLGGAIAAMATVVAVLYKTLIASKDALIARQDTEIKELRADRDDWKARTLNLLTTQQTMAGSMAKLAQAATTTETAGSGGQG
jgi:hypothetical protein